MKPEPPIQFIFVAVLVQLWCNLDGKDGNYALNGHARVDSIERMDMVYPHGKDIHLSRTFRSQTPGRVSWRAKVGETVSFQRGTDKKSQSFRDHFWLKVLILVQIGRSCIGLV